jgi:hypothetical protein
VIGTSDSATPVGPAPQPDAGMAGYSWPSDCETHYNLPRAQQQRRATTRRRSRSPRARSTTRRTTSGHPGARKRRKG